MADGVVDKLSIEIGASSTKAVNNITKIVESLKQLKVAASTIDSGSAGKIQALANALGSLRGVGTIKLSDKLPGQIQGIVSSVNGITNDAIGRVEKLANALGALKGVDLKGVGSALKAVKADAQASKPEVVTDAGSAWANEQTGRVELENPDEVGKINLPDVSSFAAKLRSLKENASGIGEALKSAAGPLRTLGSLALKFANALADALITANKIGLKAIAFIGKGLANAGRGAVKLLSGFSGLKRIKGMLDGFGASIGRIAFYRVIRSLIKALTDAFKEGLENAHAFSEGITGEGHRFAEALDSMSTAGLMLKNQLGSALIALLTAIEPIINAIISAFTRLADIISQFISAFTGATYLQALNFPSEWGDGAKKAGKAAKEWKNQLLGFDEINRLEAPSDGGGGGGSTLDPSGMFGDSPISDEIKSFVDQIKAAISSGDWQGAGQLVGKKLSDIFASFDAAALGRKIVETIGNAIDFAIGFIQGLDFKIIGEKIGDFLTNAFNSATEWLKSKDWGQLGEDLWAKFKDLIEGIDFASLAESFFTFLGAAFGAAVAFIGGFFEETVQAIKDYFSEKTEECGGDAWEGFKKGISEAVSVAKEWLKEHVVDPFVNAFKELFGIHSPSTVFEGLGENIIDGLWKGISEKWAKLKQDFEELWNGLKRWWDGLKLGSFHIPHPEFSWTYTEATGAIAKALEFVGLPSTIPHLNITWAAKGGIINGASLIGAGEAGKEAIIPLERNTEWMRGVASELTSMGGFGGDDTADAVEQGSEEIVNAIFSVAAQIVAAINDSSGSDDMNFDRFVQRVTQVQRKQARAAG